MNTKKEVHKDSKEKSRRKAIPKLKEEKNITSVNPSGRKSIAHSGICFPVRLKKPVDIVADAKHEQVVSTSSFLTKNGEPRRDEEEQETTLTSRDNLETLVGPTVEICDTNSHIGGRVAAKSVSHQCEATSCKCSKNFILNVFCSPRHSTKSELREVGKDAKEPHCIFPSKSVRRAANDGGKEEKTESLKQTVCSELKPQKKTFSKLPPSSSYRCKPRSISKTKRVNDMPQSATITNVSATVPKCVSNTGLSSEPTNVPVLEPTNVPVLEPTNVPVLEPTNVPILEPTNVPIVEPTNVPVLEPTNVPISEPLSSSEPTFEGSDADELVFQPGPSNSHSSLPSSATASDFTTNMVESQSSSRPAFWPPSVPTYKIMLKPSTVPSPDNPVSPQKYELSEATETEPPSLYEPQLSKIDKMPRKYASSSRTSRIPKIHSNPAKHAKVSQKNCGNPTASKPQRNLKQMMVKTSSNDKRSVAAKTICDSNEQKQKKSNEKKIEVSQKKSCK